MVPLPQPVKVASHLAAIGFGGGFEPPVGPQELPLQPNPDCTYESTAVNAMAPRARVNIVRFIAVAPFWFPVRSESLTHAEYSISFIG